jgi:hypothetical protein
MLIFVDKKAPAAARQNLRKFGEVVEFETRGITYEAISGHPDIFLCQTPHKCVVAPNMPVGFLEILKNRQIDFVPGKNPVGVKYPETAFYNAVVTEKFLVHSAYVTDPVIFDFAERKQKIPVKQAYTRCNLLFLNEKAAITSDKGIEKLLTQLGVSTLFVDPVQVELPGFKHGFFGGVCGLLENQVFILGRLTHHHQCEQIREFIKNEGFTIIELCDGHLFDGGGIFFF